MCVNLLSSCSFKHFFFNYGLCPTWLHKYILAHRHSYEHILHSQWLMSACLEDAFISRVPKRKVPVWGPHTHSHREKIDLGQMVFRKILFVLACSPKLLWVKLRTHSFHSITLLDNQTYFPFKPNKRVYKEPDTFNAGDEKARMNTWDWL